MWPYTIEEMDWLSSQSKKTGKKEMNVLKQIFTALANLQTHSIEKRNDPIWQFVTTEYRDDPYFHYTRITGKWPK